MTLTESRFQYGDPMFSGSSCEAKHKGRQSGRGHRGRMGVQSGGEWMKGMVEESESELLNHTMADDV